MRFKRKSKTVKNKPKTQAPAVTYIAKSTQVNADIECETDLRISGTIEGETKALKKLILTNSGTIKGTIHSPKADISGKVVGDVRVSEKLTLRPSAIIEGRIFTKKLTIEDGAQITGALQVGPEIDTDKTTSKPNDSSSTFKKNKSTSEKEDTDKSEAKSASKNDDTDSPASSGASKVSA